MRVKLTSYRHGCVWEEFIEIPGSYMSLLIDSLRDGVTVPSSVPEFARESWIQTTQTLRDVLLSGF